MKSVLVIFLLILIFPNIIAIYDDVFKDCLAQMIYDDCEKNRIWTAEDVYFPNGKIVINKGDILTKDKIRTIVDYIDILDNDFKIIGAPVENYPERFHCDDYYLRVNDQRYYWRGIEVTCSKSITNINEQNFIKIGQINFTLFQFSITVFSISIVSVTVIFMILVRIKREISFTLLKKKYIFKIESQISNNQE